MSCLSRRGFLVSVMAVGTSPPSVTVAQSTPARSAAVARSATTNAVLGSGGVHHTAIRTRDWVRTLQFYQQVLGFKIKLQWQEVLGSMDERLTAESSRPRNQRWAYLDSGDGTCVEVFEDANFVVPPLTTDPTNTPGSPIVHIGIRTTRLDDVWENARRFGGPLGDGPTDYTLHTTSGAGPVVVRLCFMRGPSGEWIELIENAP